MGLPSARLPLLLIAAAVLLIRLPFLAQPVQGDDVYYVLFARNAQVDPLHPLHTGFRLQGETVWGAGHTRPPLNAYILAGLTAVFGDVREIPFHAAYLLFSWLAAIAMYFLARRYCAQPLIATLLFIAVPAFVVNGNKLEADIPLLAFWMAGFALFAQGRFLASTASMALAGLCAYHAVFAVPILAHLAWREQRRNWRAWLAVVGAPAALVAWQLFERATTGAAPAAVLAGYFSSYGLLELGRKVQSSLALVSHLGTMISPLLLAVAWRRAGRLRWLGLAAITCGIAVAASVAGYTPGQRLLLAVSFGGGVLWLLWAGSRVLTDHAGVDGFLGAWIAVYSAGAIAVFYAGSARYLLPLAAPVAILLVRRLGPAGDAGGDANVRAQLPAPLPGNWWTILVSAALAAQLAVGLGLAWSEYRYALDYREFAQRLAPMAQSQRIWSNAEWGLRYYLERIGGEPLLHGQQIGAGSIVVTSELAAAIPYSATRAKTEILNTEIRTGLIPLRTIGIGARSGYSSSEFGILPFDFGAGTIDRVRAEAIGLVEPTASYLTMSSPEAEQQLLSGFFAPEAGGWRWMGRRGVALLRAPENASVFELQFTIHEISPVRRVTVRVNGETIANETYPQPGAQTLSIPVSAPTNQTAEIQIEADRTFQAPSDERELSLIVSGFGFK